MCVYVRVRVLVCADGKGNVIEIPDEKVRAAASSSSCRPHAMFDAPMNR
jgi:hypothetical protein